MKIRLSKLDAAASLISFLREQGCIAYFDAATNAVEAIYPRAAGAAEDARLQDEINAWRAGHPDADVEVLPGP